MLDRYIDLISEKMKTEKELKPEDIILISLGAWGVSTTGNPLAKNIQLDLGIEFEPDFKKAYDHIKESYVTNPELREKLLQDTLKALERESFRKNLVSLYLKGFKENIMNLLEELKNIKSSKYVEDLLDVIEREIHPLHGVELERGKAFSASIAVLAPLHLLEELIKDKEKMVFQEPVRTIYMIRKFVEKIEDIEVSITMSLKLVEKFIEGWTDQIIRDAYMTVLLIVSGLERYLEYIEDIAKVLYLSDRHSKKVAIIFSGVEEQKINLERLPKWLNIITVKIEDVKEFMETLDRLLVNQIKKSFLS
ncbi:MAG: hypothetical protein ACP6IP_05640 [Candidatus Njordarchaeia archaeon]